MMHTTARWLSIVAACLIQSASLAAQAPQAQQQAQAWYGKMAKTKDFDAPKVFSGAFQVELPKEWQLGPGHTGTVFLAVEKTKRFQSGGAIALEYQRLQGPVDASILSLVGGELLKDV